LSRWRQVELVKRRAAPEGQRLGEREFGEYLDQGAADDEILLDLEIVYPQSVA
jgi:hypothetical protein